jgi:hypothetical protein
MAHQADDVFLSPRERDQNREDAMREYLTWEINLVNDMAKDDHHRFRVVAGWSRLPAPEAGILYFSPCMHWRHWKIRGTWVEACR